MELGPPGVNGLTAVFPVGEVFEKNRGLAPTHHPMEGGATAMARLS